MPTESNSKTHMLPQRILPDLQSSLLCDDIRQEISGNFILLGVISVIRVGQLPVTALRICVFNRWAAGIGKFTEKTRLYAPDQTTILRESKMTFELTDPTHNATNAAVFPQVEFKSDGVYYIEISVDEVMKIRYPLPVILVQAPKPPAEGAA
ncbi:MAG: hypothetical protein JW388_0855 [Nitrospira sp.]|nr:hypothetical protein [Nitrospira sp.]